MKSLDSISIKILVMIGLFGLFHLSSCCDTDVRIGAVRGSGVAIDKENPKQYGSSFVYICPGEVVTLGWYTSNDVKSATISDIGPVSGHLDTETVSPIETTEYVLTGKGECERSSTVTVEVVKEGQRIQISGDRVESHSGFYWEANLSELIYSPDIIVTSIQMIPFTDPAFNSMNWQFEKRDPDGTIINFTATWSFSTPWGTRQIPLIGRWRYYPIGTFPPSTPPQFAIFEVTVKCK
jgi:hypothetical protein